MTISLQRVSPPKAAELVADQIRGAIARGELVAEQRLAPQPDLAEQFDVSAPTMREALRILETEGLVRVQRGVKGGTIVQHPRLDAMSRQFGMYLQMSGATIADAYRARIVLEPGAVRLLAETVTPSIIDELESVVDQLEATIEDPGEFAMHGARFHLLLLERSGSTSLAALGQLITEIVQRPIDLVVGRMSEQARRERGAAGVIVQRKLLKLLRAGDGPGAGRYWTKHVENQLAYLEELGIAGERLEFW
jgi:GntR family transcriptional regulator, transcriptional repressor for pyruvate dehydrogenase complex